MPIAARADAEADARAFDVFAVAVLVVIAAAVIATFRDYGLGWDDYTHSQYGDLLVALYRSGFTDRRALSFVNLYMYGGGFDLLSALAAKILPFDLFETRRLVGGAVGLLGLAVTWRLARRLGGPAAGLLALILLAACPLYYGHMFINAKDGPFAVASVIALFGIVRAFEEYPRATVPTIAIFSIGIGLAVGSRVLGGFAILEAVLPLVFILTIRASAKGVRPALTECGAYLAAFIPGVLLAYLVMGLVWPWSVVAPLNPFYAVEYFSNFFEKPWRELFDGRLILVPDMPRSYVPTLFALQTPALMLVLGFCGTAGAVVQIAGWAKNEARAGRRAALLAVVIAAWLPILITIGTRPAMYNGIRHFVFTFPPLAVLGGLAGAWLADWARRRGTIALVPAALIFAVGIALPVIEMVRLHPYQYTYFNRIAGGVAGARPYYMIDYWGLSMTQASRRLRTILAERGERPPEAGWNVAVCGPHPAVVVGLGSGFNAIWDPKGADFAMMLNEFYCADLDAPVVLEIRREGIVYARVYDIRGRSVSTLLRYPNANQ